MRLPRTLVILSIAKDLAVVLALALALVLALARCWRGA